MSLLEWNEDLSIGIPSLDEEHKVFIGHLNKLYDAIQFGHGPDVLQEVFDGLSTYSVEHFSHEEELMSATNYADSDKHKQAHEEIRQKLKVYHERFQAHPTTGLCNEVFAFLKEWLTRHILTSDKAFSAHFQAHGIQ